MSCKNEGSLAKLIFFIGICFSSEHLATDTLSSSPKECRAYGEDLVLCCFPLIGLYVLVFLARAPVLLGRSTVLVFLARATNSGLDTGTKVDEPHITNSGSAACILASNHFTSFTTIGTFGFLLGSLKPNTANTALIPFFTAGDITNGFIALLSIGTYGSCSFINSEINTSLKPVPIAELVNDTFPVFPNP